MSELFAYEPSAAWKDKAELLKAELTDDERSRRSVVVNLFLLHPRSRRSVHVEAGAAPWI